MDIPGADPMPLPVSNSEKLAEFSMKRKKLSLKRPEAIGIPMCLILVFLEPDFVAEDSLSVLVGLFYFRFRK
jgi:hypothetical protein